MKFALQFDKTPLHLAVEKNNIEIIKLLLSCEKIDVNCLMISDINDKMTNEIIIKSIKYNYISNYFNKIMNILF